MMNPEVVRNFSLVGDDRYVCDLCGFEYTGIDRSNAPLEFVNLILETHLMKCSEYKMKLHSTASLGWVPHEKRQRKG